MYLSASLYQHCRFVVKIVVIKETLSIIWLDNASDASIQSSVSFGISSKHQKMWGIWTPANLFLMMMDIEIYVTR